MDKKLHKKLEDRKKKGTLRFLSLSSDMIDFGSNDYLGLAKIDGTHSSKGSTGSRLISGHSSAISLAEESLAVFFGSESALCFNSGYDANIGLFSSIPQRGDIVLYDEHIHASVRDGIRLSLAKGYSFKHNDIDDLRRLLNKNSNSTCYIAIEALYSMNGDFCPLLDVVKLAEEYSAYIILDEAHSAGIYGLNGRGFSHALDLSNEVFIRLVTFGKAYGSHGAVVLCGSDMKSYLINFARSIIYTTALPRSNYVHIADVVENGELKGKRDRLQENIAYFRDGCHKITIDSASNSPIQIIRFESIEVLKTIDSNLKSAGIFAKVIYAPTVPEDLECLRICIHTFNTADELNRLLKILNNN